MDQIQHDRQKIIEKLVKIKALAERGIGGEQQTAQVMYATLKEKYKVTDAEIEKAAAVPVDISEIDLKSILTAIIARYVESICFRYTTRT